MLRSLKSVHPGSPVNLMSLFLDCLVEISQSDTGRPLEDKENPSSRQFNTISLAGSHQQGYTFNRWCSSARLVQSKVVAERQSKIAKQQAGLIFRRLGAAQTFACSVLPPSVAIISDLLTLIPANSNPAAKSSSAYREGVKVRWSQRSQRSHFAWN